MVDTVDTLFIDEAGQILLANVVAASGVAHNLVFFGDPQQLDQPLRGVHPPAADRSALAHLIGDGQTMPTELGLFLDGTYRLPPEITSYTSELFYDGLISSNLGRELESGRGCPEGSCAQSVPNLGITGHYEVTLE